jgi:hypothetical protein
MGRIIPDQKLRLALADEKARMVHIRLDADLHRALRLIVAEQDTTLQDWISRILREAVTAAPSSDQKGDQ